MTTTEYRAPAKNVDGRAWVAEQLQAMTVDGFATIAWWQQRWWRWRQGCWRETEKSEVENWIVARLNTDFDDVIPEIVSRMLLQLRAAVAIDSELQAPCWLQPWDGAPDPKNLLVCRDRTVDLPAYLAGRSSWCWPPMPRLLNLSAIPHAFPAAATPPTRWLEFLGQLWPDDVESIETLQEFFGLCLLPETKYQKMLWLVGPSGGGKGTILALLEALLGAGNTAATSLKSLSSDFGFSALVGKLAALIPDARLGRIDPAAVVEALLTLAAADCVPVNAKHRAIVSLRLHARIVMASNELPRLPDAASAMLRRLIILRLRRNFVGQENFELAATICDNELPGILRWSIDGLARLRHRGHFRQPASALQLIATFRSQTSIEQFLVERCEEGEGLSVWADELYAAFQDFCRSQNIQNVPNKSTFGTQFAAARPASDKLRATTGCPRPYYYTGLALRPEYQTRRA